MPLVGVLQDVGVVLGVHARHHDVAALHVPDVLLRRRRAEQVADALDPRTGGVDHRPRADRRARAAGGLQRQRPAVRVALRADQRRAHAHVGPGLARGHRDGDDQPRVVHPRIGVDEAPGEPRLQPGAPLGVGQLHAERPGQRLAAAEVVVQEQARADHPRGAQVRLVRQHERQRRARGAAPSAAPLRARRAIRGPGGTRSTRGSAARRGSAWCSTATSRWRCRPSRPAAPTGRGRPRRGRCRRR